MEYCGGGSVADLVHAADGPLEQPIIAYLCAETLSGLTYLHSIGKVPVQLTESGLPRRTHGTHPSANSCMLCRVLNNQDLAHVCHLNGCIMYLPLRLSHVAFNAMEACPCTGSSAATTC